MMMKMLYSYKWTMSIFQMLHVSEQTQHLAASIQYHRLLRVSDSCVMDWGCWFGYSGPYGGGLLSLGGVPPCPRGGYLSSGPRPDHNLDFWSKRLWQAVTSFSVGNKQILRQQATQKTPPIAVRKTRVDAALFFTRLKEMTSLCDGVH